MSIVSGSIVSGSLVSGTRTEIDPGVVSLVCGADITASLSRIRSLSATLQCSATIGAQFVRLRSLSATLECTCTITVIDAGVQIFAASQEFITWPTDTLPNQPFLGTLEDGFEFHRTLVDSNWFRGVTAGWGVGRLNNWEADYDPLLREYAFDAGDIRLMLGELGASYNTHVEVFHGSIASDFLTEESLELQVRDNTYIIEVPAQPHNYSGTGSLNGGEDLKSKSRPRAFGPQNNYSPPLVYATAGVYQLNDGQIQEVTAVKDLGSNLVPATVANYATATLLLAATRGAAGSGADIEAGEYATCLAEGYLRLGGVPFGTVTVDFKGDKAGGVYVVTAADISRRILGSAPNFSDPAFIYLSSFAEVNALQPAIQSYLIDVGSDITVADAVADVMAGVGGWGGFRRRNDKFEVGILVPAEGTPHGIYTRADIVEITRERLPGNLNPPPWRFRVPWGRNLTVQTDLAGRVTDPEVLSFLKDEWRYAESDEDDGAIIQSDHPLAQDPPPVDGNFAEEADAEAEADRLLGIYGLTSLSLYRIVLHSLPLIHDIGQVIHVTYPRWDLVEGRLLRIVGVFEKTINNRVELIAMG